MAFNPAAIHGERSGFNPPLGVRKIQVAHFRHGNASARGMAFSRGIATQSDLLKPIACEFARLIRGQFAYASEDKAARAAFAIAVLNQIGLRPARLDANAKALERSVTGIPFKHIQPACVGAQSYLVQYRNSEGR